MLQDKTPAIKDKKPKCSLQEILVWNPEWSPSCRIVRIRGEYQMFNGGLLRMRKRDRKTIFCKRDLYNLIILILSFLILMNFVKPVFCQYSNSAVPISYFYTSPLFYTDYGYINSIIEPFYYLGYGYKPPIEGNTTLAWNLYTPFNNAYSAYLLNFFEIPTFNFFGSLYHTTFPYQTLPGTGYPYTRFQYPTYSYGSSNIYQSWLLMQ